MKYRYQIDAPAALSAGKSAPHSFSGTTGGPQSRSGLYAEEKSVVLLLPGFERRLLGFPCRSLVTITTVLLWHHRDIDHILNYMLRKKICKSITNMARMRNFCHYMRQIWRTQNLSFSKTKSYLKIN